MLPTPAFSHLRTACRNSECSGHVFPMNLLQVSSGEKWKSSFPPVLASNCFVMDYHKVGCLSNTHVYVTVLQVRRLNRLSWFLCSGFHKAKIKVLFRVASYLEAFGNYPLLSSCKLLAESASLQR